MRQVINNRSGNNNAWIDESPNLLYGELFVNYAENDERLVFKNSKGTLVSIPVHITWDNIENKPDDFATSAHEHAASDITSGILPVERGGTGKDTLNAASNDLINALNETSDEVSMDSTIVLSLNGNEWLKTSLNGVWNALKENVASDDENGLIQIGYVANGKNYPIVLDNGKAYVNVDWKNTTYTISVNDATGDVKLTDNDSNSQTIVTIDSAMSETSTNPVQNKVVNAAIKQAIDGLIDGAPDTYDTLKEIAEYIATHKSEYEALQALASTQSDWNETGETSKAYIKNKPDIDALIKVETDRATSAETEINSAITYENVRATTAEIGLQDAITAENTRATDVEADLQEQINNIQLTPGPKGDKGEDGDSAYEIYVSTLAEGETALSETEWLASLKGADGTGIALKSSSGACVETGDAYVNDEGHIMIYNAETDAFTDGGLIRGPQGLTGADGKDGSDGVNGKSAYEIAVENGYTGTVSEWLTSLKGDKGEDGKDGSDGSDGVDGATIIPDFKIENGYLYYSVDGKSTSDTSKTWTNLGEVKGADGSSASVTVENKDAILKWGTSAIVATINTTDIKVSLPENPNTDTHYTTHLYAGTGSTSANTVADNGNVKLKLFDDTTLRNSISIVGSGATSVTSSGGTITIASKEYQEKGNYLTTQNVANLYIRNNNTDASTAITADTQTTSADTTYLTLVDGDNVSRKQIVGNGLVKVSSVNGNILIGAYTGDTADSAAAGNHTHNGYATTTALGNYLPLSGGQMATGSVISAYTITASGAIHSDSAITTKEGFFETSDERLKTFGEDVEIDFDKLKNIPKKHFVWSDSPALGKQIGTSAQKVKELYPEIVSTSDSGILSVAYDKLAIIALAAIDKLKEENDELKARIKEIEEKLG